MRFNAGTQDVVPPRDFIQSTVEHLSMKLAVNPDDADLVVQIAERVGLLEQPILQLRERQRRFPGKDFGRNHRRYPFPPKLLHNFREMKDGGVFKKRQQGQLDVELALNSRNNLQGFERIAAEIKEVVGGSNAFALENLAPHSSDRRLYWLGAWSSDVRRSRLRGRILRRSQPIDHMRQVCDGGILEERNQGQLDIQRRLQACNHFERFERITSQIEKVVAVLDVAAL